MLIKETLILIPFLGRREKEKEGKDIFFNLTLILQRHSSYYSFYFDFLHLKNMLSFK